MNDENKPVIPLNAEQTELREKLLAQMRSGSIKAVSFKMDEVLIVKPFSGYADLFMQLERDLSEIYAGSRSFSEMRIVAQDYVETKYGKRAPVTLDKIYDRVQKIGKLSPTARQRLQQRECELAEYYSSARELGLEMFHEAKNHGKKIYIIADTIYPRATVERILSACGFTGYTDLVLPSELNIPDSDRHSAIDNVIMKANLPAGKLLHIGPSVGEDVELPIMRGQMALMLSPVLPLMVRSGRLRGFVEAKHLLDSDSPDILPLHCLFGLYARYCFDVPRGKAVHSDFCGSAFMMGFIVLGGMSLCGKDKAETPMQRELIEAMEKCEWCKKGLEAFRAGLSLHFGDHLGKYGAKDCQLPLIFLENHAAPADRELLRPYLPDDVYALWQSGISEPDTAPVYFRKARRGGLYKVADKLFPPGSRVRNLADGMLTKMRR